MKRKMQWKLIHIRVLRKQFAYFFQTTVPYHTYTKSLPTEKILITLENYIFSSRDWHTKSDNTWLHTPPGPYRVGITDSLSQDLFLPMPYHLSGLVPEPLPLHLVPGPALTPLTSVAVIAIAFIVLSCVPAVVRFAVAVRPVLIFHPPSHVPRAAFAYDTVIAMCTVRMISIPPPLPPPRRSVLVLATVVRFAIPVRSIRVLFPPAHAPRATCAVNTPVTEIAVTVGVSLPGFIFLLLLRCSLWSSIGPSFPAKLSASACAALSSSGASNWASFPASFAFPCKRLTITSTSFTACFTSAAKSVINIVCTCYWNYFELCLKLLCFFFCILEATHFVTIAIKSTYIITYM